MSERLILTTGEVDKPPGIDAVDRRIPNLGEESGDITAEETPSISRTTGKLCWNTTSASATIVINLTSTTTISYNQDRFFDHLFCFQSIFDNFKVRVFFSSHRRKIIWLVCLPLCIIYDEQDELWVTGCNRWVFCTRGGHGGELENGIFFFWFTVG